MKCDTKSIIIEAETWEEAGKAAECAHIQEDPNFSYVDEGTWGMIESTPIEPVPYTEESESYKIPSRKPRLDENTYALQVGEKIVTFDDSKKQFGIYRRDAPEIEKIKEVTPQSDAEKATEGKTVVKCGRCKRYGHGVNKCTRLKIPAYAATCADCGWKGELTVSFLDAVCPEGHVHLNKIP